MTVQDPSSQDQSSQSQSNQQNMDAMNEAIANAVKLTSEAGEAIGNVLHDLVERSTETVGQIVTPIAENSFVQYATRVPGLRWLMAAIGQVDVAKVEREVADLKQKYPLETPEELANRVINDITLKAAGIGFLTNAAPPLALSLFAVDLTAIAALQAELTYHIAAIYGFSLNDPTRRGELLAVWGLSTSGAGVLKTGLNFIEVLPVVGTVVGPTSNAALMFSLGHIARLFYDTKVRNMAKEQATQRAEEFSIDSTSTDSNSLN
ncbi:EcsC family protein [Thermocoleostomius sinensis]|uniref:EcsC family protein n=1 Tax=Thermocoleostomius sinensis A174 TaxID=2016057 RepID=A0A9E9C2P8_9CYAN|nr:EcsC family protein [Thermocoleostomius sinensis]WAL58081.1 hypothetical protein OXH18_12830 [Thermocoleostomius sinensis A174]